MVKSLLKLKSLLFIDWRLLNLLYFGSTNFRTQFPVTNLLTPIMVGGNLSFLSFQLTPSLIWCSSVFFFQDVSIEDSVPSLMHFIFFFILLFLVVCFYTYLFVCLFVCFLSRVLADAMLVVVLSLAFSFQYLSILIEISVVWLQV